MKRILQRAKKSCQARIRVREVVKYYFADFVRKGGKRGPPKSVTAFSPKILSVKGEGGYPPNP